MSGIKHPLFRLLADKDPKQMDDAGLLLAHGVVTAAEDARDFGILQPGQTQLEQLTLIRL